MAERDVERKLTAILAADVVGYSRLMEADEAGTLAQMKTHRRELRARDRTDPRHPTARPMPDNQPADIKSP